MEYGNLTIIIPTLNEQESIGILIKKLEKLYPKVNMIVADDGSTDDTRRIVTSATKRNLRVRFLDRSSRKLHGLTISVVDAEMLVNTKYTIVMDADLQHPPELIKKIYERLGKGADLAIGSRETVKDWQLYRKIISKTVTAFSIFIFKLKGKRTVNDMMSGFFGIKTSVFKHAIESNKSKFVPSGYKVLLDILNTINENTKIVEVPYKTFHRRLHGASKSGVRQMIDLLHSISN